MTEQCRFYNRYNCRYGIECWYKHDDSVRTKFQENELIKNCWAKQKADKQAKELQQDEERFYKKNWVMKIKYNAKENSHSGYCSDPGSVFTIEKGTYEMIRIVPHYVKPEHLDDDSFIVDKEIFERICKEYSLDDDDFYCGHGTIYTEISIKIEPGVIKC